MLFNLHSIMYLLILETEDYIVINTNKFTFHNVSINSKSSMSKLTPKAIYIP